MSAVMLDGGAVPAAAVHNDGRSTLQEHVRFIMLWITQQGSPLCPPGPRAGQGPAPLAVDEGPVNGPDGEPVDGPP
jgi:hypothetical protein